MKIQREPRVAGYEVTAKCFDGKIVNRVEKFRQIQFQQHPSVIVADDGSVRFSAAKMIIEKWNNQVCNTNYTYSITVE
jgi:hypothetical protein